MADKGLAVRRLMLALVAATLAGCSGTPSLSTGSLFGSDEPAKAAGPVNDPPMRAFQVGTVSARAIKCGFNFDPAKLKASYLMYESRLSAGGDLSKLERIYDVSFNGVAKAVAGERNYCSAQKTKQIKSDLTRHLAGDYTPTPRKQEPQEEGIFSGWGSGGSDSEGMISKHPMDNSGI
jgi:hypothetical protein